MGPPSRYAKYAAAAAPHYASSSQPFYSSSPSFSPSYLTSFPSSYVDDSGSVEPEDLSDADWARYHLTRLARARDVEEFKERSGEVLARTVNVTVNGMHVSRELYAKQWGASASASATVEGRGGSEEVSTSGGAGINWIAKGAIVFVGAPVQTQAMRIPMHHNAVLIGLQYDAVFTNADDGLGAEAESDSDSTPPPARRAMPCSVSVTSSINVIIAEDKSLPAENSDRRRIFSVNQIIADKSGTVVFPIRD